jgi:ketosteroid isomerase-like protein
VVKQGLVEHVEAMLKVYVAEGIDALLAMCDDDVEWAPHGAGDEPLHGSSAVREFFVGQAALGERRELTIYSIEELGDAVLATGALRRVCQGRLTESQVAWVFQFRDGRLRSAIGYPTRAHALRAVTVAA